MNKIHKSLIKDILKHCSVSNLKSCVIDDDLCDDDILHIISQFDLLESLQVSGHMSHEGLRNIRKLDKLQKLLFRSYRIGEYGLEYLPNLQLQELDLRYNKINSSKLCKVLRAMTSVKSLCLLCTNVTNEAIGELSSMNSLRCLDIRYCNKITGAGIQAISTLPLNRLCYSMGKVDDLPMFAISQIKTLTSIDFPESYFSTLGMASLQALEQLDTIELELCYQLSDDNFLYSDHLNKFLQLRKLDLSSLQLESNAFLISLSHLGTLSSLEFLNLSHTPITDLNIFYIFNFNQFPKLRQFYVQGTSITNASLDHMIDFPLEILNIASCENIDNGGLSSLEQLKKLKTLYLDQEKAENFLDICNSELRRCIVIDTKSKLGWKFYAI